MKKYFISTLFFFLCSCSHMSLPTNVYVIDIPDSYTEKFENKLQIGSGPVFAIMHINIPSYLNRPQIVLREKGSKIYIDERHRWGENLDKGDRSVISRLICLGIRFADGLFETAQRRKKRDIKSENSYRFLREAANIAPVVMSLGNHEMYLKEEDRAVLREAGVSLLDNTSAEICGILVSIS